MYHFASTSTDGNKSRSSGGGSSGGNKLTKHQSLNATQTKSSSNPLFLRIEEELHDARRVRSHGQEDDLRGALDMVIGRVEELTSTLSEVYKAQAELEAQLNVAKSNLQLVIMNNDMLEEALKKNNAASRDLGWRRTSSNNPSTIQAPSGDPRASLERSQSMDLNAYPVPDSPASAGTESRFFKFRFGGGGTTSSANVGVGSSRPGTPAQNHANAAAHLTSPSLPSLTSTHAKELEELEKELEKERAAKKKALEDKAALEDEVESLSQALFEEANKMVAQERMKLADTEEELREVRTEKEALQRALRLLDDQTRDPSRHHGHLRKTSSEFSLVNPTDSGNSPTLSHASSSSQPQSKTHSRSSSQVAIKSALASPVVTTNSLPALPLATAAGEQATVSMPSSVQGSPKSIFKDHGPNRDDGDDDGDRDVSTGKSRSRSRSRNDDYIPISVLSPTEDLDEESQPTPRYRQSTLQPAGSTAATGAGSGSDSISGTKTRDEGQNQPPHTPVSAPLMGSMMMHEEASPWADVPTPMSAR
ncbi:hypothetical protein FA15DRAFT_113195 [Coprinopsis marcescibilis]|uniref:GDP/GTP exchange factor Sec2 N-terminal domain-containing protein n=1 Tax=Coprinopsis marcescibilis TaxID=230819 RepID=A0A5C3KKQ7_COPMA|nr:hypothetical protein FA15DRAFT_113195 [Coprinopsis marcescibilis]